MEDKLMKWALELQSLAQAGLFYGHDIYDRERYQRIREIAAQMIAERADLPVEKVTDLFFADSGYQTPKVDTRAVIPKEGKLLFVRENDGRWCLPGGWCEYNISPVDNAVKEAGEEAGLSIAVKSVIAVQNRDNHCSPPYPFAVVRIFYLCEALGGSFTENIETTASSYFGEDELPPLAEEKCSPDQIQMCFAAVRAFEEKGENGWTVQFD